jgi:hypothetical protein
MSLQNPTHITVRVEFVTRPKRNVTAENVSRQLLPWSGISHEVEVTLGNSGDAGIDILGVDRNGAPTRDWFWDGNVFPLALDAHTEILPGSGWVKITYTIPQDGQLHVDTACYPVDASTHLELDDLPDLEFVLRQNGPNIKLIFPAADDAGNAPICPQLQTALGAVPPNSFSAAGYRIALVANRCVA